MSPQVVVVEHESGCPPDRLAGWLAEAGCDLDLRRPYAGDPLPAVSDLDGLVVLGGQMGAYDDEVAPWLPGVRRLLRDAVSSTTPVLGVCLGAQLLAVACGGRVERGALGTEAGVVDVDWRPEAGDDALVAGLPAPFPGPSMHEDAIVELPPNAVSLASTERYPHQVVRVGQRAWGVQFHPEVSADTFRDWAQHHPSIDPCAVVEEFVRRDAEVAESGRALARRFAAIVGSRVAPLAPT